MSKQAISDSEERPTAPVAAGDEELDGAHGDPAPSGLKAKLAGVQAASERHMALAVPLRAAQRNRRVAASVLAGGFAYKVFLWLLPFGLIVGGALGFLNADNTEDAVSKGGLPGAITNAIGDASRSANSESWWLFLVGVPLLLWAGFSGAKAAQLIHALVWDQPPPKTKPLQGSLAFTALAVAFMAAIAITWWFRDDWPGLSAPMLTFAPLAGLWLWISLQLPHRDAPWKALLPGALLVAIGFQALHKAVSVLLVPKLEKSTSLYGSLGATTTVIFFIYLLSFLVVMSAVINSSLYEELESRKDDLPDQGAVSL